jgi:hypothetical protein
VSGRQKYQQQDDSPVIPSDVVDGRQCFQSLPQQFSFFPFHNTNSGKVAVVYVLSEIARRNLVSFSFSC